MTQEEDTTDDLVSSRLNLIHDVESQMEKLPRAKNDSNAAKMDRRLAILEKTVDMYYAKLNNLVDKNGEKEANT